MQDGAGGVPRLPVFKQGHLPTGCLGNFSFNRGELRAKGSLLRVTGIKGATRNTPEKVNTWQSVNRCFSSNKRINKILPVPFQSAPVSNKVSYAISTNPQNCFELNCVSAFRMHTNNWVRSMLCSPFQIQTYSEDARMLTIVHPRRRTQLIMELGMANCARETRRLTQPARSEDS